MENGQTTQARLVGLLAGIRFADRYYQFCDARAGRKDAGLTPSDYESALAVTGLEFKYDKRERFYGHQEPLGS